MAAGNYQVDLQLLTDCEATTGFSALGGGGAGLSAGVDFAIQGTNAVDKQVSNNLKGMVYDNGSTLTLTRDDHIFIWEILATPGICSSKLAGGIRITIGTTTGNYYEWYVNGNDTLPEGGMRNYAIFYTGSTVDNTVGSPGAAPQVFGGQADVVVQAKGVNFALDVMRYGTGMYIFQGDTTEPITFESASRENDSNTNRWGVLSAIPGGFSLKGRFVVGQDTGSTPSLAYFSDSNTSVVFTDTEFSQPDFTQIIVDDAETQFISNNISYTGIGTNNPGIIRFENEQTTGSLINNTFNSIGNTFLNANVRATGSTWVSSAEIYQSSSILFESSFRNTSALTSSLISNRPDLISSCVFEDDGNRHGIEIISTGSYTFSGNQFSGFVSGSNSGSALLFNPPGSVGDLVLNVVAGGGAPSFTNLSAGTVTINNNIEVTLTGMQDETEIRVFTAGTSDELAGIEDATDGSPGDRSFSFALAAGTIVDIAIISVLYVNQRISNFTIPVTDSEQAIQQQFDRNYSNP